MDIKLEPKVEPNFWDKSETPNGDVYNEDHSNRNLNEAGVKNEVFKEHDIHKNLVELDHNIKLKCTQWDKCIKDKDASAVKKEKNDVAECTYAEWIPEQGVSVASHKVKSENLSCKNEGPENTSPIKIEPYDFSECSYTSRASDEEDLFLNSIKRQRKIGNTTSSNCKYEVTDDAGSLNVEKFDVGECSNTLGTLEQVPVAKNSTSILNRLQDPLLDIQFKELDVKNKILGLQQVVAINLEKMVFYDRNFVCSVCMQIFASLFSLNVHKNDSKKLCIGSNSVLNFPRHDNVKVQLSPQKTLFNCDICDFKSAWQSAFKRHKQLHTGEKPFKCDQCIFTSARQSVLKRHIISHTGERPFKCDQCSYTSAQKSDLKRHKLSHTGERPYKCDQCDFTSASQFAFKQHKLWHTGERPFKCDQCKFTSVTKCKLKYHKSKHTSEKPFKCDSCKFTSALQFVLKRHKLSHTGEKPFKCDQCEFRSGLKCNLKTHKLIHSGEKPFECDVCDFKSAWQSALKQHKQLHNVSRPFKCDKCDFGFLRASDLKRHKLWHSGERSLNSD